MAVEIAAIVATQSGFVLGSPSVSNRMALAIVATIPAIPEMFVPLLSFILNCAPGAYEEKLTETPAGLTVAALPAFCEARMHAHLQSVKFINLSSLGPWQLSQPAIWENLLRSFRDSQGQGESLPTAWTEPGASQIDSG